MQKEYKYGIIILVALKRRVYIILKPKLLKLTKETAKVITIIISGFLLILAMIFIKYKPAYEVTIAGEKLGYI